LSVSLSVSSELKHSLYECMRLAEWTLLNITNFVVYRKGHPYVDFDAKTEDFSQHHVHCPEKSLPQSPVRHSLFLGNRLSTKLGGRNRIFILFSQPTNSFALGGRRTLENRMRVFHLFSNSVRCGRVVHKNLNALILVLGSSPHSYRPSVSNFFKITLK
jgi:hypothetical protein